MLQAGTLAFLAGILILQTSAALPPHWLIFFLLPTILLLFYRRYPWLQILSCLLAGFLWAQYQASTLLQQRLPEQLSHKSIVIQGYIANLPMRRDGRQQFEVDVTKVISPNLKTFPHKIRLSWYTKSPHVLMLGQLWQLSVRLHAPRGFMDPGAFDYAAWLLQKGISATGYVHKSDHNRLIDVSLWRYPVQLLRYKSQQYLRSALSQEPSSGLIQALLIGDRSGISKTDWRVLQSTGTVHLMAISGLHIGLVAGFTFFLMTALWRRLPGICLYVPAVKAAAIAAWLAAWMYAAMAGFAIPTQRALIMLAVILLSVILQRQHRASQNISIALLLVLIWDPFAVLSASFWLSFSAVTIILIVLHLYPLRLSRIRRWWRIQLAISLGLFPLVLVYFQQAPLLSPFINLVAIPWVSLLILPLGLVSMLFSLLYQPIGTLGLQIAAQLMHALQVLLSWLVTHDWGILYLPTPGLLNTLLAVMGVTLLILPKAIPARYIGILMCLPLFFPADIRPRQNNLRLTLLDVGQGLAAVVQTHRHTLVFDTGPRFGRHFDSGEAVILPYLRQQGIHHIDTLVISHSDSDHIGGLQSLEQRISIHHILTSVPKVLRSANDALCVSGDQWVWDGVTFTVLHPDGGRRTAAVTGRDNNRSCVLQVSTRGQQLLLTGDIEYPAESDLVSHYGKKLQSTVLVIPHHGSKTSSSSLFLNAVHPTVALIPAGWHNRFHFPARIVLSRLRAKKIRVLNTTTEGAIDVNLGSNLRIQTYRTKSQRYWQAW